MSLARRGGFTLLELLAGLSLAAAIGTILVRSTLQLGRAVRGIQQRAAAQAALDQAGNWIASELYDLAPGDLRRIHADSLSYRATRATGLACAVTATTVDLRVDALPGGRLPQPGRDSLLLYRRGLAESSWRAAPIRATGSATCGSAPVLRLETEVDSFTLAALTGTPLVPIRIFESMQARLYQANGEWWLGARSESSGEAIQPLAGPFAVAGVQWRYLDSSAGPASTPATVRQYQVQLVSAGVKPDTATLQLLPRNLRP